jgi:hypothetical protein
MIKRKILMEITPRVSLVFGGESRKHNFRGSFKQDLETQTQDQYIGFNVVVLY